MNLDHDDDCCCDEEGVPVPAIRFSIWDIFGIAAATGSLVADSISDGFGMLSNQFASAAERSRTNHDLRREARERERARRAMARDLRGLTGIEIQEDVP